MTARAVGALVLFALVACKHAPPAAERVVAQAGDLAIVGATVIPMDRDGVLTDHAILIRDGKIAAITSAAALDASAARVIDGKGKWVVPGLADMHVHVQSDRDFALFLLNGVTTVRDLFGSPQHLTWRAEIASGKRAGPTLIAAGPIIDGTPPTWPTSAVVTTPDEARAEVKRQRAAGYDVLKVYDHLTAEVYAALVVEAKQQGMPVVGHVPDAVGVAGVIAAGQRSIEHLDSYVPFAGDGTYDPALVALTASSEVWNSATLVVTDRFARLDAPASLASTRGLEYVSAATRTQWDPKHDFRLASWTPERFARLRATNAVRAKLMGELARANARFVLGTDAGNPYVVPGFAVHDELALLVAAGLTRMQALRAATAAPAELSGTPATFGTIRVGARADLVIADRDPLADLSALAEPSTVIVRGTPTSRAELLAAARAATKPVDPLAALPPIESEGEPLVTAQYDVEFRGAKIGAERATLSTVGAGRVVRGQAVFEMPTRVEYHYRSTVEALELWQTHRTKDGITVTRHATRTVAQPAAGEPLELATAADAIVAPQAIATFFWHAARLSGLAVGATRTITTAELVVEGTPKLDPGRYEYRRTADVDGRVAYALTGTHGKMAMTGRLVIDSDGAPSLVEIEVPFGKFVERRIR